MEAARVELEHAIVNTEVKEPICPIYQNIDAKPYTDPAQIKHNLIAQLTGPVRWTQTVKHMMEDGATSFTEVGPGSVLQGLVKKVDRHMPTETAVVE
jgi:[acyl-carrier-protein] S-malonyltransferase